MKMFWQDSPPPSCTANQFYVAGVQMYHYSREGACLLNKAAAPRVVIKAKPVRLGRVTQKMNSLKKTKTKKNPDDR